MCKMILRSSMKLYFRITHIPCLSSYPQSARTFCYSKILVKNKIDHKIFQVFTRTLYSAYILGIEGFRADNDRLRKAIFFKADTFEQTMSKSIEDDKAVFFTGDIKNLIALSEVKPELLELTLESLKRYYSYSNEMKLQPFNFGPIIMRLFYCLNNSELALQIFQHEGFKGIFNHVTSYQLMMDMLLNSQQYEKVIDLANQIIDNDLFVIPQSCLSLALAANCRIKTKASLEHSLHLLRKQAACGKSPTFRAIAFAAYHAICLEETSEAMNIISRSDNANHFLIHNLELLTKCRLGRIPEVLDSLRVRALIDTPKMTKHSVRVVICKDVLGELEKIIMDKVLLDVTGDNDSIIYIFNKLKVILENSKLISSETLEEAIFSPIDVPEKIKLQKEIKKLRSSPILRPVSKWD